LGNEKGYRNDRSRIKPALISWGEDIKGPVFSFSGFFGTARVPKWKLPGPPRKKIEAGGERKKTT
jgi:hypothetical protein